MDDDEFMSLTHGELGFCPCADEEQMWLLRELLEIGESRLFDYADEDHEEHELYIAGLRLNSALPDWHSRVFVLGTLGASQLILHEDGATNEYWLDERGVETLAYMRAMDQAQSERHLKVVN